jgi:adenine-specific DNA-methyltransferase
MNHYKQLSEVLNDIFELNKADLDFGIYRIINHKRKQVTDFIENQLPNDIKRALSQTQSTDKTEIENELKTLKRTLDDAGIVAESSPKYKTLMDRLDVVANSDVLEQEVFSHLANFFRRYYKDGDFISMRRYKKDVYAIPYEGEEVKLHWANHDQYYIKSSENFKNYSFHTADGHRVTFQLKEVSTEQNNNKTQGDAERRFAIYSEEPVEMIEGQLYINFVYEPFPKATKQEALLAEALETLSTRVPATHASIFALSPTEKNSKRTVLERHLQDYISKNSFDYFIHKDLGGFLSRELDYYIKNEVLYIDDINDRQTEFFVAQLSKIKAIKVVAHKVIDFLAQIENFQKKLWLKKKFVISTQYCITLDKIPSSYYAEIFANKEQLAEWKTLFDVDIQNEGQLVFEPYLVLDTKFFDEAFKDKLLAEFDDLDEQTNGLLINSENFQALNLMQGKYQEKIDVTYIDPPYNAKSSEIVYKNTFKNSSFLSFIHNRIYEAKILFKENSLLNLAIDDYEVANVKKALDDIFGQENFIANITVIHNPRGRNDDKFYGTAHEYMLVYSPNKDLANINNFPANAEDIQQYNKTDSISKYTLTGYMRTGNNSNRFERPNLFYSIYVNPITLSLSLEKDSDYTMEVLPINADREEKTWRWGKETFLEKKDTEILVTFSNGEFRLQKKRRFEGIGKKPKTIWHDSRYDASTNGIMLMKNLFNSVKIFSYPKSIYTVLDALSVSSNFNSVVLDYFAGSGTTGHATIKLNREDGGNRKYILVEMGTYFNTVTKPRIQKVIYSDNWKNGKPQDKGGISQIVKYQVLESYEDTLNNLFLKTDVELDFTGKAKEQYLLQYMLDIESREHLFNLEMFRKPFDYELRVTENNELRPAKVDLVETFNYLIGLYVSKVQRVRDIKVVEGTTRTGIKTLVIWRDLDTTTHDDVSKLMRRFYDSQRTRTFQQIYINGDHHLENIRIDGDQFKIKGIEETFFKRMFNEIEL